MTVLYSRRSLLTGLVATSIAATDSTWAKAFQQLSAPPADKLSDRFALVHPSAVRLHGLLGERCRKSEQNWLLTKNENEMLRGFQQRPGKQAWVGEHVGKWLHAATLAWVYTGDADLRVKLDRVVNALLATQQPDGYLGTYTNGEHWAMGREQKWDVWVHKYNLLGLITYANYTGQQAALDAAKKIGDLLVNTFGANGQLDLNERSTHVGMASGSVLEPLVLLYRVTGEQRYLDFARLIVDRWETEKGPKLTSALSAGRPVNQIADAKAYEMLSCLVGLCELYRATGEAHYLNPVLNAWLDIVGGQLLITGSGSSAEHWTEAKQYPSSVNDKVAETCVTVTWIQVNQQLLRLTGNARYADELEKTFYNHLAAAQRPDGAQWCYFTALDGKKPYQAEQNCCTSSGPRAWAMLPSFVYQTTGATGATDDGIVINFFTPSTAFIKLNNGKTVTIKQETNYPEDGHVTLSVTVPEPLKFSLRVRVPAWSQLAGIKAKPGEYWLLRQTWSKTQTITLDFAIPTRTAIGGGKNSGRVAVLRGPLVFAVDEYFNPDLSPLSALALASPQPKLRPSVSLRDADGLPVYETDGVLMQNGSFASGRRVTLRLIPFASAGALNKEFAVWLGAPVG
jgi:uncharacterized protein